MVKYGPILKSYLLKLQAKLDFLAIKKILLCEYPSYPEKTKISREQKNLKLVGPDHNRYSGSDCQGSNEYIRPEIILSESFWKKRSYVYE
jgi:hypothetical protein